jgi:hypothetical protein
MDDRDFVIPGEHAWYDAVHEATWEYRPKWGSGAVRPAQVDMAANALAAADRDQDSTVEIALCDLARIAHCSTETMRRSLAWLRAHGWVGVFKHRTNVYLLVTP